MLPARPSPLPFTQWGPTNLSGSKFLKYVVRPTGKLTGCGVGRARFYAEPRQGEMQAASNYSFSPKCLLFPRLLTHKCSLPGKGEELEGFLPHEKQAKRSTRLWLVQTTMSLKSLPQSSCRQNSLPCSFHDTQLYLSPTSLRLV